LGTCGENFSGQRRFVGDNRFRVPDAPDNFFRLERCAVVDGQFAQSFKTFPGLIAGVFHVAVQDYYFHGKHILSIKSAVKIIPF
jgi:hypothetical protein